ncbi:MAG: ABC transporter permease [Gemmatimonadetes bacterium]|nr:ABC transporter permease [Gemmatimonadota bacterium]
MRSILALARVDWLSALSYRFQMLLSVSGLIVMVFPLFLIARAVDPIMGGAIQSEGGDSFGFLLVGMAVLSVVQVVVNGLPGVIGSGIRTGTLEALLSTPVPLWKILTGLVSFQFGWSALRSIISIVVGAALGATIALSGLLPALIVAALTMIAHVPIAMIGAAMVFAFRTPGPLPRLFLLGSTLLGGVYYPTHVIPSWLERLADLVPLTYGLRAIRRTLLQGASLVDVGPDVLVLAGITAGLGLVGTWAFRTALAYARRNGTLAQY